MFLSHRLVKSITKGNSDSQTQTNCDMGDNIKSYGDTPPKIVNQGQRQPKESKEFNVVLRQVQPRRIVLNQNREK